MWNHRSPWHCSERVGQLDLGRPAGKRRVSKEYHRRRRRSTACVQPHSYQVLMDTGFRLFFRSERFDSCSWSTETILEIKNIWHEYKARHTQAWLVCTKDPGSGLEAESKTNPDGGTNGDSRAGKQPGPQTHVTPLRLCSVPSLFLAFTFSRLRIYFNWIYKSFITSYIWQISKNLAKNDSDY